MKEERIQQFKKLIKLYELFIDKQSINKGIVIKPENIIQHTIKNKYNISFFKCFSNENIHKGKTSILIFGSQHKPDGDVINGAKAQEEDIALV